jgi:two-component system LytT family response regulator
MRTVIIDDEANAREAVRGVLEYRFPEVLIVGEADGVFSGLKLIKEKQPDLVFLDIKVKDGSGFDLLSRLEDIHFSVIFLTAYDSFALKAFRFSATDYLLKPIDVDDLHRAIEKVKKNQGRPLVNMEALFSKMADRNEVKKIVLKTSDSIHLIKPEKIIRCEAQGNYALFHVKERKPILVSGSLKEYEKELDSTIFFRCHQSHLVNTHHIEHVDKRDGISIVCSDGSRIPVSVRKRDALMQVLENI